MSDTKFTEWSTRFLIDENEFKIEEECGDHVCTVETSPTSFETDNKHAHLIASAPDMYKALEYVISRIENIEDWWWITCEDRGGLDLDRIESVLAKARGE